VSWLSLRAAEAASEFRAHPWWLAAASALVLIAWAGTALALYTTPPAVRPVVVKPTVTQSVTSTPPPVIRVTTAPPPAPVTIPVTRAAPTVTITSAAPPEVVTETPAPTLEPEPPPTFTPAPPPDPAPVVSTPPGRLSVSSLTGTAARRRQFGYRNSPGQDAIPESLSS
jgi:hypothetical protein